MEVKGGPQPRNWGQVSKDATPNWSLPRVSEKICVQRLRLAGHGTNRNEETSSKVLLWESKPPKLR